MLIIVDGVDLSGKSTLAKMISDIKCIPVIKKRLDILKLDKREKLNENQIEVITRFFFDSIFPLAKQYDFVLDRGLISSLVYSKFFNRDTDIDYVYKYLFNKELNKDVQVFITYCSDENVLKSRFETRGERLFTFEEILEIQKIYMKTVDYLIMNEAPIIKIDTKTVLTQDYVKKVLTQAKIDKTECMRGIK
jgi:thymidylate kinase